MPLTISTFVARLGWLAAAILIALGSAGLVTALDHRPGAGAREELTWAGDQALTPPLEAIVADLDPLALDFVALGSQGRSALAALVSADTKTLDTSISTGQRLVDKIAVETTALRKRIASLPGLGPGAEARISGDLLARVETVTRSLDSTDGVAEAWATLATGSSSASHLVDLLTLHDTYSGQAVQLGSQGKYADAVMALDQSDPVLAQARSLRDKLANTADVSTLTQWLDRNATIDTALRRLYTILARTNGTVTDDARKAFDEVKAAEAQLPPDTRALVVIMADIARAGLNQAVIRIEESRGRLADAIASLEQVGASPSPSESPGPEESVGPGKSTGPEESLPPGATPNVTPPDA